MIRHYEEIGIIPKAARTLAGYRTYTEVDAHTLRFVKKARAFGFSMKEIKKLVGLWQNKNRKSSEVKALTLKHINELETKMSELGEMVLSLKSFAKRCQGGERPDCPILKAMEKNCKLTE